MNPHRSLLGLQVCPKYFFLPCFQELRIPIIKKWVTWESVFITACFHSFLLLFPGNIGLFPQAILLFTRLSLCFISAHSDVFWPNHAHVHVLLSVTVYYRMVISHPWSLSSFCVATAPFIQGIWHFSGGKFFSPCSRSTMEG